MKSAANLVDRLGGILTRPTGALRAAAEERHLAAAIGLILLASLRPFFLAGRGRRSHRQLRPSCPFPRGRVGPRDRANGAVSPERPPHRQGVHGPRLAPRPYLGLWTCGLSQAAPLSPAPLGRTGAPQPAAVVSYAVSLWALVLTVLAVRGVVPAQNRRRRRHRHRRRWGRLAASHAARHRELASSGPGAHGLGRTAHWYHWACKLKSRAYSPSRRTRKSWSPSSTMRPSLSTTMRCAMRADPSRCDIMTAVLPLVISRNC